ncbi:hypothetical protein [Bacillus pseudomycoides]|uniref:hypothetical protein n=1 Tax=Bacillus pseudomycoides TaxID=64104 RepID=UPI000BEC24CA|nr:hypothetical protein [Bacillus pseudomycoides]MED4651407.1 hypothetical protein [Bacillus pseudomycoides]PEE04634.1 hypothetical protein CON86_18370 [Bacillus pseudomycoides]PEM78304.1 hypothetical protein CN632_07720 [Bacillus pseudomycoides]PHC85560.1 hypothetical protein COF63_13380 [Bacillus pseudomycoides]
MGIFVSEVETFLFCSATITQRDCTFDFVVRSTPIGIAICLVEDYEVEWLPMRIETYLKVNGSMFPDEDAKEEFRKQLNSENGWMLDKQGDNLEGIAQRAMRADECEAFQTIEKNIPREMRKDVTTLPFEHDLDQAKWSTWRKRPNRLM